MLDWLKAAQWLHSGLVVLAAIGFFRFLFRTRFWFPKYLHWLAVIALAIGFGLLALISPEAPVNQGDWTGIKKALIVLLFPGIVYFTFVFYGGQHAAYEARWNTDAVQCPNCGQGAGVPGDTCDECGQTIPPSDTPPS